VASVLAGCWLLSLLIMAAVGLIAPADGPAIAGARHGVTAFVCAATVAVVFSQRVTPSREAVGLLPWDGWRSSGCLSHQVYSTRGDLVNVLIRSIGVQVLRIVQAYFLGLAVGIAQPFATTSRSLSM
jgi:hypothetical protein